MVKYPCTPEHGGVVTQDSNRPSILSKLALTEAFLSFSHGLLLCRGYVEGQGYEPKLPVTLSAQMLATLATGTFQNPQTGSPEK